MSFDDSEDVRLTMAKQYIKDNIGCRLISKIDDFIYDKAYFYDTNFHLNDTGVELRTRRLAQDLMVELEIYKLVNTDVAPPPLPESDVRYFGEDDANASDFVFEKMENGAYAIVGVSESGMNKERLTIPLAYDGYKVTAIGANAFAFSSAREIVVTADSNLRNFFNDSFKDSSVGDVYIYYNFTREEDKLAPASDFFGVRIHVGKASAYIQHYDWLESSGGYEFVVDIE